MGGKSLIPSFFRPKKPPMPMSHAEFEELGMSVRVLAKIARKERERPGGDTEAGKDSHFCRSGKTTLAAPRDIGKASQRRNADISKQVTEYLLRELRNGRFTPQQVDKALQGLPRDVGKNIDVVALDDQFDDILSLIDPGPLKPLSAATSASANAVRKCLEELERGCPADGKRVRLDATARKTAGECKRAFDGLVAALTHATDCGDKFTQACGWNPSNPNLENSLTLHDWFNGMFQQVPATNSLKAMSLPVDLLVVKFDYVTELKDNLEKLLSQREMRGHEPGFHDEVQALSEEIVAHISRYTRELFTVAELLTQFPYYPTDPARRKPLLQFAQALADLARAMLDPASTVVQVYEWARDARESAVHDKVAARAAAKENDEVKKRLDAGDRLAKEVDAAYEEFEAIYLCSPSGVQQRLLNWMTPRLNANPHTQGLSPDSLHDHLFVSAPQEIKRLYADLEAKIDEWNRADEHDAESVRSLVDLSGQLAQRIDTYVAQIEAVSRMLQDRPEGQPLPAGAATALDRVAHLMAQHVYALGDSQGFLEKVRAHAEKVHGEADRLLNQFEESSAPDVVSDDSPLESLPFDPSPSPDISVASQPKWLSAQPRVDHQLLTTPLRGTVGMALARTPDGHPAKAKVGWWEAVEMWVNSVRDRLGVLSEQFVAQVNTVSALTPQQQALHDWLVDTIQEYPAIGFAKADDLGQLMDYRWDDLIELTKELDRLTALSKGGAVDADLDEEIVEISSQVIAAIDAHLAAIRALLELVSKGGKNMALSLDQRQLLTNATQDLQGLRQQLEAPEGWLMAVRRDALDAETTASQRLFAEEKPVTAPAEKKKEKQAKELFLDDDIAEAVAWKAAQDEKKNRSPFKQMKAFVKGA